MSSFQELNYELINTYNFIYENPVKDTRNIYLARLKNPIKIRLPTSEILEIYQDELGLNNFKYLLSPDNLEETLNSLYKLDELAIEHSELYSKKWFGKELKKELLQKYYVPPYNTEEIDDGEVVYIDITFENMEILDDIIKLNEGSEKLIDIEIEGIRFFKKSFSYQFVFKKLVSDDFNFEEAIASHGGDSDDDNIKPPPINTTKDTTKDTKDTTKDTKDTTKDTKDTTKDTKDTTKDTSSKTQVINKSFIDTLKEFEKGSSNITLHTELHKEDKRINSDVINDLADISIKHEKPIEKPIEKPVEKVTEKVTEKPKDMVSLESTLSKIEVQSRLEEKRKEARTHFLNAERANRAAEALRIKAMQSSQEAKDLERTLKSFEN